MQEFIDAFFHPQKHLGGYFGVLIFVFLFSANFAQAAVIYSQTDSSGGMSGINYSSFPTCYDLTPSEAAGFSAISDSPVGFGFYIQTPNTADAPSGSNALQVLIQAWDTRFGGGFAQEQTFVAPASALISLSSGSAVFFATTTNYSGGGALNGWSHVDLTHTPYPVQICLGLTTSGGPDAPTGGETLTSAGNAFPYFYVAQSASDIPLPVVNTTTRIDSVSPPDGGLVATSTLFSLGATGYVNPGDIASSSELQINVSNQCNIVDQLTSSTCNVVNEVLTFPISSSGSFNISTTTSFLSPGIYTMTTQVFNPGQVFGWTLPGIFGNLGGSQLVATTTQFIVGTTTPSESVVGAFFDRANNILLSGNAAGQATSSCAILTFNASDCLTALFIPPSGTFNAVFNTARSNVLSVAPWGYITQFIADLSTTAPVEPPPIAYTFGSSSPAILQGDSYSINPFDYIGTSSPIYAIRSDDGKNENIYQIVDPYFQVVVAFAVLLVILSDIMGLSIGGDRLRERETESETIYTPEVAPGGRPTGYSSSITRSRTRNIDD